MCDRKGGTGGEGRGDIESKMVIGKHDCLGVIYSAPRCGCQRGQRGVVGREGCQGIEKGCRCCGCCGCIIVIT